MDELTESREVLALDIARLLESHDFGTFARAIRSEPLSLGAVLADFFAPPPALQRTVRWQMANYEVRYVLRSAQPAPAEARP